MSSHSHSSLATPASGRILIAEEALHSVNGHWFEYIKTIADACRGAGDDVTVVAHRDADPRIVQELNAHPIIPFSAWDKVYDSPVSLMRYAGVFQHNWRLYRCMDRFLRNQDKFDCILAPTLLIHHVMAWTALAKKYRKTKYNRMVLFFVNGQGIYQGPGKRTAFPSHPKATLFRKTLQQLRPLVESGEVILAAETEGMAREYEAFCGVPFQCFPHVVSFEIDKQPKLAPGAKMNFACFGFARHEKGSDLLQEAILAIRERRPDLPLRFTIQWLEDFDRPDGSKVTKDPSLLADPDVEFITEAFGAETYCRHLSQTHGMILPYRARSYYARVSRVAIEAAIAGIPLVYTEDTWLEEMTDRCGAGEGFRDEDLEGLIDAIIRLAEHYSIHKARAEARSDLARDYHSPAEFRKSLLRPVARQEAPFAAPVTA